MRNPGPFQKGPGIKGAQFDQRLSLLSFGGVREGTPFGCPGAGGALGCPTCGGATPIFLCTDGPEGTLGAGVGDGGTGLLI